MRRCDAFSLPQVGGDGKWIMGWLAAGGCPPAGFARPPVGGGIFGCGVLGGSSGLALPLACVLPAITPGIHLKDHGFVAPAITRGDGGGFIREQSVPCAERPGGGDHQGALLTAHRDPCEQDGCFGFVPAQTGEVIEDRQVEPVQGSGHAFAPRRLQSRHEIGGAAHQHAATVLDQFPADGRGPMALADPGRADGDAA